MAAIDKIYGTAEQYDELRKWLSLYNPDALMYLSNWSWDDSKKHQISLFPQEVDIWLLKNCTISWVTDYICDQYSFLNKGEVWKLETQSTSQVDAPEQETK